MARLRVYGLFASCSVSFASWISCNEDRALPQPKGNRWALAKHYDRVEAEKSLSSSFILLYNKPAVYALPEDLEHYVVSNEHRDKGFAIRLGTGKTMQDDLSLSHFKVKPIMSPRVLLVVHWRGGLEVPGGHRDPNEAPAHMREAASVAAERELLEEAGVTLKEPLSWDKDALAVMILPNGEPRWTLFARELDRATFDAAVASGPKASTYNQETYGNCGPHVVITFAGSKERPWERVYGLPRLLNTMNTVQGHMLLAGLVACEVLTEAEAAEAVSLAHSYREKGGLWTEGQLPTGIEGAKVLVQPDAHPAVRASVSGNGRS